MKLLKPKKSDRQKRIKELDKLWSLIIRTRADNKCELCGAYGDNPHHIFTRSKFNTRWSLDNGICLCSGHHTLNSSISAHKSPRAFLRWLEDKRGKVWLDRLETSSEMSGKGTDLRMIKMYLENELKKLSQ